MSQQVYTIEDNGSATVVSDISPLQTVTHTEYYSGTKSALEYFTASLAASDATYLNSIQDAVTYVVVGPHPRPR